MPTVNRREPYPEFRSVGIDTELLRYLVRLMMSEPLTRLTARQVAIFFSCCMHEEPQSVRVLSRYLKVSRPSVSLALRRLERLGLLKRTTDRADRRGVVAEPTEIGRALLGNSSNASAR
jgi:DNA-binding MarR family transcriptional regulator